MKNKLFAALLVILVSGSVPAMAEGVEDTVDALLDDSAMVVAELTGSVDQNTSISVIITTTGDAAVLRSLTQRDVGVPGEVEAAIANQMASTFDLNVILEDGPTAPSGYFLKVQPDSGPIMYDEIARFGELRATGRTLVFYDVPAILGARYELINVDTEKSATFDPWYVFDLPVDSEVPPGFQQQRQQQNCQYLQNAISRTDWSHGSDPERNPDSQLSSGHLEGFYTKGGMGVEWKVGSRCGETYYWRESGLRLETQFDYYGDYQYRAGSTPRATAFGLKAGVSEDEKSSCTRSANGGYVCNGYTMKIDKVQAFQYARSPDARPSTAGMKGFDHDGLTCTRDIPAAWDIMFGVAGEFVPGLGTSWALLTAGARDVCTARSEKISDPAIWNYDGMGMQVNTDSSAKDTAYAGDITYLYPTSVKAGKLSMVQVSNYNIEIEYNYASCNCGWAKYDYWYGYHSTSNLLIEN